MEPPSNSGYDNYGYAPPPPQPDPYGQPPFPQQQQPPNPYGQPPAFGQFPDQFSAAFNNPIVQSYAEGYKKQIYEQYVATSAQTLKYYFAVDTNYVVKKIGLIMCPFLHKDWSSPPGANGEQPPPKYNINAPDLYIPVMSFLTYVLVAGFVFGTQDRFEPEKLGLLTTNALFYLILENLAIFVTKFVLNISHTLNVWHSLSYSCYKYVSMVFCLLCFLIGGRSLYYCALAYSIFATVFFLLRSMKIYILDMANRGGDQKKRKLYLLLSITLVQGLIIWLLTSSVTSYMPGNYNIAKMALDKIGLKKHEVPMTHDGEVDYEALLKMD
ncbi:unnamed protein product [Bursaphelenchus xylophilus]|uniref:Protein YIF1 n=1 Tax=Bursaphelenchus xylophilus TaxID=6326 RepID=A0A1I7RXZ4_BURXY|nr:unnamed protein product [Bursaphelenchus xylophilus]CAG9125268.1 unnamed protein product [Bursaphelenchus xylophilus]